MQLVRVVIVDDEPDARRVIGKYLERYFPRFQIVGEFGDCISAVENIPNLKFDVLFLDIHLSDGTGFDVLSNCPKLEAGIIFTTAFDQYAVKAFSFHAVDYLLKPIEPELFINAVNRALQTKQAFAQGQFDDLLTSISHKDRKLSVPTADGFKFIHIEAIQYLEADSSYCTIYLQDEKQLMVSKPMKFFCDKLEGHPLFVRPHKSYFVNLSVISDYIKDDGGTLKLTNGKHIPISRQKKDEVLERMNLYFL